MDTISFRVAAYHKFKAILLNVREMCQTAHLASIVHNPMRSAKRFMNIAHPLSEVGSAHPICAEKTRILRAV
jgi:hypothetical protein